MPYYSHVFTLKLNRRTACSEQGYGDDLKINADTTVYRASLEKGYMLHFDSKECRFVFRCLSAGELFVNGQKLGQGDQACLDQEKIFIWRQQILLQNSC